MRKYANKIFFVDNYLIFLFAMSLAWALFFFYDHLSNPIYDMHGFRQAQTAISVRYLLESKSIFSYETPVLGYPWSIPFEFPTYQLVVRSLTEVTHLPIESAGRIVSFIFFLLTAYNGTLILKILGENRHTQLFFLTLFFSSPLYLFWSRTVMIESTALYFTTLYLYLFLRMLRENNPLHLYIGTTIIGCLAATTKATTFAPFLFCGASFFLIDFISKRSERDLARFFFRSLVLLIPVFATLLWNHHADYLKSENPIARGFIDSKSLTPWNFGTLSQKLSLATWKQLIVRTDNIINSLWIIFCSCALFIKRSKRCVTPSLIFLFSFFSAYLVFTNLHFVHDYYPYSNGIFLIFAIALIIGAFSIAKDKIFALTLITLAVGLNYLEFSKTGYQWVKNRNDKIAILGHYVKNHTPENSIIITTGLDWSSELPFEANRRALMMRAKTGNLEERYHSATELIRQRSIAVSAFVNCDTTELSHKIIKDFNLSSTPVFSYDSCSIHTAYQK